MGRNSKHTGMGRKKGVALSAILMITEVFSTLLLTPFMIRTLGQAEYGVYKLTSSVSTYLMLLDLGMGGAVIRFIASYKERNDQTSLRRFFGVTQIYYLIIALIAAIFGGIIWYVFPTVFAVGLTPEEVRLSQTLILLLIANAVIMLGTSVFRNAMIAYSAFGASRGAGIVRNVLRIFITWFALEAGFGSIAVVTINLVLTVFERGYFVLYVFKKLHIRPQLRGVSRSFVREIVGYSSLILLQLIATQINDQAGSVLLGMFVPSASLVIAVFGVGTQVLQYFKSIAAAFTDVLMPGVVRIVESGADASALQAEMVRVGRLILLVLLCILGGFIVYGMQFIKLWAGAEYVDGYIVALLLMSVNALLSAEYIGTQIMWAKNQHKEQAILKFIIVIANIALTIALIKWNPLIGAALGLFISLFLGDIVVMNIVFKRKIGISLIGYYKGLLKGILPAFVLSVGGSFLFSLIGLSGWYGFIGNVAVHCVIYGALAFLFGMNTSERNIIKNIVRKLLRRSKK